MATTWIKAVHRTSSGSIRAAIQRTLDYTGDYTKTRDGDLIAAYECDPATAVSEFLLSKKIYEKKTGRNQGWHDVIGYHIRQSFKPGEVTAEEALKIGYELALRWTKGNHQFIVTSHTNTNNPHIHIFFNSVTLDNSRKYTDFKRSAIALRRVSDMICIEHGLSIIEKPGLSKGHNREEYLGISKAPNKRDKLIELIDTFLCDSSPAENIFSALKNAGCEIKYGKRTSIKPPWSKRYFRLDTLGYGYTESTIFKLSDSSGNVRNRKTPVDNSSYKFSSGTIRKYSTNLLINIEQKIAEGKGAGYEHWAKIFNLKEAAKTLVFLQENDINSFDELKKKASSASGEFSTVAKNIREIESRQKEISELQRYIGQYTKTRNVYAKYKASGWSREFYEKHTTDIILHRAAKKYFNEIGKKKLPSIAQLKQEYAKLSAEKKALYSDYHKLKKTSRELITARTNCEQILGISPELPTQKRHLTQENNVSQTI
ncbi:MAG: relaxase/mobilization nuclease domain-containing protein [Oscillospiraceae bacterium]|nr:relaxase/mobilization nuclease domain-containing protein [Oscillospiraceae bacterium]